MRVLAIALVWFALVFATDAEAQRLGGRAPHPTPYSGLLPEEFELTSAPALDLEHLRRSKVVLIPSSNFNDYARVWSEYYEEGGFERDWVNRLSNIRREQVAGVQLNSDPRAFADRVADAIRPHVGELAVAHDLPEARDIGGDYIVILDAWFSADRWRPRFRVAGGVHMLDGSLRHVLSLEGAGEAVLNFGMFSDENEVRAVAMVDSMTSFSLSILSQLEARLQSTVE